jgi:L-asparagine permease
VTPVHPDADATDKDGAEAGYHKDLGNRQVQMIAIGGAIGVGLFLGAGGRLKEIGPSLILAYLACGIAAFFVMRALGELVVYRTRSGSFVSYSRDFIGPWAGFVTGWMFWVNWAFTGIAELTAIGIYVHKWLPTMPQWITALAALVVVFSANLISVRLFGELEFWFSMVKVLAISTFLVTGLWLVISHASIGGGHAGPANLFTGNGLVTDFFPTGFAVALLSLQAVIFAYNGVEMVGIAASEAKNPKKIIPRAINSVAWRIGLFYCGSVLLLVMILPWTAYGPTESPFVVVFSSLGVPAAGHIMNLVVITAAWSSANSGLYSTSRIMRGLADVRQAPRFTARMSGRGVPVGGLTLTAIVYVFGVGLNYLVPSQAFDIVINIAGLGTIAVWSSFLVANIRMRAMAARGELEPPPFRMPFAPWSNYLTLAFLLMVVVLLGFAEDFAQRVSFYSIPVVAIGLFIGWRIVRKRTPENEPQLQVVAPHDDASELR